MPMQPSPMAETVKPCVPSFLFSSMLNVMLNRQIPVREIVDWHVADWRSHASVVGPPLHNGFLNVATAQLFIQRALHQRRQLCITGEARPISCESVSSLM